MIYKIFKIIMLGFFYLISVWGFASDCNLDCNDESLSACDQLYVNGRLCQEKLISIWENKSGTVDQYEKFSSAKLFYIGLGYYGLFKSERNVQVRCSFARKSLSSFEHFMIQYRNPKNRDKSKYKNAVDEMGLRTHLYLTILRNNKSCFTKTMTRETFDNFVFKEVESQIKNQIFVAEKRKRHLQEVYDLLGNMIKTTGIVIDYIDLGSAELNHLMTFLGNSDGTKKGVTEKIINEFLGKMNDSDNNNRNSFKSVPYKRENKVESGNDIGELIMNFLGSSDEGPKEIINDYLEKVDNSNFKNRPPINSITEKNTKWEEKYKILHQTVGKMSVNNDSLFEEISAAAEKVDFVSKNAKILFPEKNNNLKIWMEQQESYYQTYKKYEENTGHNISKIEELMKSSPFWLYQDFVKKMLEPKR